MNETFITPGLFFRYLRYLLCCLFRLRKPLGYNAWFYDGWLDEDENEDLSQHWLCVCGHYEESGLHCSACGHEPPWGCDCSFCNDRGREDDDETNWYDDPYFDPYADYELDDQKIDYSDYDPSNGDKTYDERSL